MAQSEIGQRGKHRAALPNRRGQSTARILPRCPRSHIGARVELASNPGWRSPPAIGGALVHAAAASPSGPPSWLARAELLGLIAVGAHDPHAESPLRELGADAGGAGLETHGTGSSCSARTSARSPRIRPRPWPCCAPSCSSSRSASAARRSLASVVRRRMSTSARRSARVLDGDLDGFARSYLLKSAK